LIVITIITLILAFLFTFTNGFQDAGSIAATFIASRCATPVQGIMMVGIMNFLGALLGGSAVALTISGLLTAPLTFDMVYVLFAALFSAIVWNIVTWKYGLPSSSTHAIIGGLLGAGIAFSGIQGINWGVSELLTPPCQVVGMVKILLFLILSVCIGFIGGFWLRKCTHTLLINAKRTINKKIVRTNWITTAFISFLSGANNTQKQLGIIAMVLVSAGDIPSLEIPGWTRLICAIFLACGTFGGGWRIMKTLGNRIFRIKPVHSFDSQTSSGAVIMVSTIMGAPVSSSHIITSSIIGVGIAENRRKVHWSVGTDIIIAMIMTIPITMFLSACSYTCISWFI